jgi:hypothetical protein
MACIEGRCQHHCEEGLTLCQAPPYGYYCADLSSSVTDFGACTNACVEGEDCVGGACGSACETGLTYCNGSCVDVTSDPHNCGECGVFCGSGVCDAGVCAPESTTCAAGLTYCPFRSDGQPAGCYDLATDYWHCGTCDMSCPTAGFFGVCSGGQCVEVSCGDGLTYCAAQGNGLQPGCYDLSSDRDHCGACDSQCPTTAGCFAGECGLPPCEPGLTRCAAGCVDLDADPDNCGACDNACDSGVCEAGACALTATQAITQGAATGAGADETATAQEAATGASASAERTRRDRTRQREDASSEAAGPASGSAPPAGSGQRAEAPSASVLDWPFDLAVGQWTIVHGYRAVDDGGDATATSAADNRDFARFAFELAVCPAEDIDAEKGACALAAPGDEPTWDREATQVSVVVSPVDGTVAWTEGEAPCLGVAIDVAGHPGYRLALFNVEGKLERGQRVTRGKRIGKVAKRGCERGDRIRMVLYQPRPGANADPVEEREGVPFADEWAIAGCNYPDDGQTADQYRAVLVPCSAEDDAAAGS